jgi:hypothetical protein
MNRFRVITAFLLSPFVAALYLLVLVVLFDNPDTTRIGELVTMVVFLALIGFVAEIVLGIPMLLVFRHFHLMKLPWFLLGGFVIGVDVFGFFEGRWYRAHWGFVYCVIPAIMSTAAFWLLGWSARKKSLDANGGNASHI